MPVPPRSRPAPASGRWGGRREAAGKGGPRARVPAGRRVARSHVAAVAHAAAAALTRTPSHSCLRKLARGQPAVASRNVSETAPTCTVQHAGRPHRGRLALPPQGRSTRMPHAPGDVGTGNCSGDFGPCSPTTAADAVPWAARPRREAQRRLLGVPNAALAAGSSPEPRPPAPEDHLSRPVFWKTALQQISTGFRMAASGRRSSVAPTPCAEARARWPGPAATVQGSKMTRGFLERSLDFRVALRP